MIKAIIFDVDGVLINGKRFSDILHHDYGITQEKTLPFFTGPFQECLVGNADLREEIQPYLKEWGWQKTVDDFLWYWFTAEQHIDRELFAYIEVLKSKGIHVYVASNNEKHRTAYLWNELGFSKVFAEIFSSAHIGHVKHQLQFFEKMLKKLPEGVRKDEILLWDDDMKNIQTAQEFGLQAEFYSGLEQLKKKTEAYLTAR